MILLYFYIWAFSINETKILGIYQYESIFDNPIDIWYKKRTSFQKKNVYALHAYSMLFRYTLFVMHTLFRSNNTSMLRGRIWGRNTSNATSMKTNKQNWFTLATEWNCLHTEIHSIESFLLFKRINSD